MNEPRKLMFVVVALLLVMATLSLVFASRSNLTRSTPSPSLPTGITKPSPTATPSSPATEIPLDILSPTNGVVVENPLLTVKGKTAPSANVFVNDEELKADSQGNFSVQLTLDEGDNIINVVANDAVGNGTEKELTVTYQVAE